MVSERPRLSRRVDERLVAGVAGGIADWLNISASFVRVLLLFASIALAPWLLIAYGVAALLVPARGRRLPDWDNLVAAGRFGLLFAVPFLLYGGSIDVDEAFDRSPELWVPVGGLLLVGTAVLLTSDFPRGPTPAEARARVLGTLPVAAFAAAVGLGLWLVPDVRWEAVVPLGAILAGLLLALGARRGSWRALVAPGVLATCAAAALIGAEARLQGGVGDRVVRATAAGGLPPTQRLAVGDLGVDLRRLRRGPRTVTFRASVGVGDLKVIVPRGAHISLDARVGRGELNTADYRSGFDLRVRHPDAALHPFTRRKSRSSLAPRLHLIADVGIGTLEVERASPGEGL